MVTVGNFKTQICFVMNKGKIIYILLILRMMDKYKNIKDKYLNNKLIHNKITLKTIKQDNRIKTFNIIITIITFKLTINIRIVMNLRFIIKIFKEYKAYINLKNTLTMLLLQIIVMNTLIIMIST